MSYILNALRKSERERQAIEPDTVTSRIVIQQAQQHKSSRGLIAALVVINLGILIYFLAFNPNQQQATQPSPANLVSPQTAQTGQSKPSISKTKPTPAAKPAMAESSEQRMLTSPLPLAGKPTINNRASVKPVTTLQPVAAPSKPPLPKTEVEATPVEEAMTATMAPLSPVVQPAELDREPADKPVPTKPKTDLPYLQDLPSEVSRSLPVLSINVFSYSTVPAERFVMIDMVKYVPGQSIKDGLQLKEIREDSIVVSYDGYTFKIRRP